MEKLTLLKGIGIFFAMTFSDLIWVFYIRRINQGKAAQAALTSMIIVILGALIIISYVENIWYLVPAVLGAFTGTFLATKFDTKKNRVEIPAHKKILLP